jgi:hypothetical protein
LDEILLDEVLEEGPVFRLWHLAVSPDGMLLAAYGSREGGLEHRVWIWDQNGDDIIAHQLPRG